MVIPVPPGGAWPDNVCPFCEGSLGHTLTRKSRCPSCRREVWVRRTQEVFPRPYLSEWEAKLSDLEKRYSSLNLFEYEPVLQSYSVIPNKTINETVHRRLVHHRFDNEINEYPGVLRCARAAYSLGLVKDLGDLLLQIHRHQLSVLDQTTASQVKIRGSSQACRTCAHLHRKVVYISEALDQELLPHALCENNVGSDRSQCRCYYKEWTLDDALGMLSRNARLFRDLSDLSKGCAIVVVGSAVAAAAVLWALFLV